MSVYYPPVGFHFQVVFGIQNLPPIETSFQEVSGLDASFEMESVKEGGQNRFVHRLPTQATYGNLILKRGMLVNTVLIKWFEAAILHYDFNPITVSVVLLNADKQPQASWAFTNAIPVKWSVSNFNAMESSMVAETIELSYNYMRRVSLNADGVAEDVFGLVKGLIPENISGLI